MDMRDIATAIREKRVLITKHARIEADKDKLAVGDILQSTIHGSIVTPYPEDKPYSSCLILGWIDTATPLHSVWAYNAKSRSPVLVTVYRPDPKRWIDWKTRATP